MSGVLLISKVTIVLLIVLVVLAGIAVALYFLGKKAQKREEEQREQIDAMKQTVSMLIIDKKRMKIKDSGLPQAVIAQTPKLMRWSKLPIVKAKVGPQVLSLVCDDKIFDNVPVKKEVKATVSGIYITSVKGLHGDIRVARSRLSLRAGSLHPWRIAPCRSCVLPRASPETAGSPVYAARSRLIPTRLPFCAERCRCTIPLSAPRTGRGKRPVARLLHL